MAFKIELSRRTTRDIEEAFEYIHVRAPGNAIRWRRGLERQLQNVGRNPEAFGFAPENKDATSDIRQHLFGNYRILYTVRGDTVFIITVRHGARAFLSGDEVDAIR